MNECKIKFFDILKSTFIFQDLISWTKTKIPFIFEHNLAKYDALKKAFYISALDNIQGDYCEFGVFTGSSFVCALRSHQRLKSLNNVNTTFYGFDSFTGFGEIDNDDKHCFYINQTFSINKNKVLNFIKKRTKKEKVKIIEGLFEKTLKDKSCKEIGIDKARIIFIDCDMKQPTKLALNYMKQGLQEGTIIILDDFFSYKGNKTKGTAGAFYEFSEQNPNIEFRELFDYGMGSKAFIISRIKTRE